MRLPRRQNSKVNSKVSFHSPLKFFDDPETQRAPMVKKSLSHYAPRPLQQPQMPDMKQVKRSVCNHIRHFSLLSYLPSAGNPSTQPPIRRLALPLIRSIAIIPPTTPHNPNSLFSNIANTHRQFLRSHRPHAAPNTYRRFREVVLMCVPPRNN